MQRNSGKTDRMNSLSLNARLTELPSSNNKEMKQSDIIGLLIRATIRAAFGFDVRKIALVTSGKIIAQSTSPINIFNQGIRSIFVKEARAWGQEGRTWSIMSWNITSMTVVDTATCDAKLIMIQEAMTYGPVALQETHWVRGHSAKFTRNLPHARIISSPATSSSEFGTSGGTAVILPTNQGYKILDEGWEAVPGYVLRATWNWKNQVHHCWSVYLPPGRQKEIIAAWKRERYKDTSTDDDRPVVIVIYDFNADTTRELDDLGLSTQWTPSFIPSVGKPSHIDRVAVSVREKEDSELKWQWKRSARTRFARHTPMSLTVEMQPKTRDSADIIYRAIPPTAFLGNEPSLQELTRKLIRKAVQMGMPWHVVMNPRQCPQNPFDPRNHGVGPDLAIGIPQANNPNHEETPDPVSTEGEEDYCPWATIDAFTGTMWEWWNYMSKSDKLRIGSLRAIIKIAIEQAEANNKSKVEIPVTVVDRAYAFIDMQNGWQPGKRNGGNGSQRRKGYWT
eukprot:877318-Heterocapsa_arctica.AAC.1